MNLVFRHAMSDVYHIPAYDPAASTKLLKLKEVFAGVDQVFSYALPESRRNGQTDYGIPNPHAYGVYSRIRRAWLSGFRDIGAFKADIFPPDGFHLIQSPLEKRLRRELRVAFFRHNAAPYGQPTYAVHGTLFESPTVRYGAFSFENHYKRVHGKPPENPWVHKTFQIVERAEDRINICYVRTKHNGLPMGIHHCADQTMRVVRERFPEESKGLPVQLFLYTPKEGGNGGPESFSLVDQMMDRDGTDPTDMLIPLDRTPPVIPYLYHRCHKRIQPDLVGDLIDSPYMDFRGFALRTMAPPHFWESREP